MALNCNKYLTTLKCSFRVALINPVYPGKPSCVIPFDLKNFANLKFCFPQKKRTSSSMPSGVAKGLLGIVIHIVNTSVRTIYLKLSTDPLELQGKNQIILFV